LPPISSLGGTLVIEVTLVAPGVAGNIKFQVNGIDPAGGTPQVEIVSKGSTVTIVSGAAVGVPAANGSQWEVTGPQPGSGPSFVLLRTFVGANYTEQSLMIPEVLSTLAAQATAAVDANGNWQVTIDGSINTGSWKYLTSTSAYPSDASVTSGGTFVSGRTFSISGGPLTFGQTLFVTAIPSDATHGTAILPSVHARAAYLTYSASKTLTWSRAGWQDITLKGYTTDTSENIQNPALLSSSLRDVFRMVPAIARGVTLVSASFDCIWVTATNPLGAITLSVAANGGTVAFGNATYAIGAQSVTFSLGSTVNSSGSASFICNFQISFGSAADAAQAAIGDVSITYTMPTPDKTV
jgi:hypothetical protein